MRGYIAKSGERVMLKKGEEFRQSESGKTGYFIKREKDGSVRVTHKFCIFGTKFI